MKGLIVALIICVLVCPCQAAEKAHVDDEYKAVEEQMEIERKKCAAKVKGYAKYQCAETVRSKYKKLGKIRGSDEYCDKNYKNLGFDELENLLKEIQANMQTARILRDGGYIKGEVTYDMFGVEETWIKIRLGGMQKVERRELDKKLFNEKP
jgi:hypothetical protein